MLVSFENICPYEIFVYKASASQNQNLMEFIFIYFFVAFRQIKCGEPAFACYISIKYLSEIRRYDMPVAAHLRSFLQKCVICAHNFSR